MCPACLLEAGLTGDNSGLSASEAQDRSADNAGRDAALSPTTPYRGGFVAPAVEELAPLFPQLELLGLLGQGGMGAVYQARQKKLDRFVALKIIRPESADDPAFAERFMREARTLARLSHPSIVAVHDFGEVEADSESAQPLYYFVMEYVDGASLRQLIASGELSPEQALTIVPQICEALQYAHDEGVVHRDIKPENILVDLKGRVRIADFGLAKLAARSSEDFTLTATHQVMGTPRYMAPEQMTGSRHVDHRADIYSLGVVLYEMLTGEVPMGQFSPPSQKAAVDIRLDEVVMRALAQEPDRRFQQASELKSSVDHISSPAMAARPDAQLPAGPSTIMERELIGAWRWVAGAPASMQQVDRTHPLVLSLLLTIAGCVMLLLPWCDVDVAGPAGETQHDAAELSASITAVIDDQASATAASFSPPLPEAVQAISFPLLAQEAWPGTRQPVRAHTQLTHTFRGFDLIPSIMACGAFAVMTLMLISFPDQIRRSVLWNVLMGLLAVAALLCTLAAPDDAEYCHIRIPVDPNVSSGNFIGDSQPSRHLAFPWFLQDEPVTQSGSEESSTEARMVSVRVRLVDHTLRLRAGFVGSFCLSLAVLVLSATGVRNSIASQDRRTAVVRHPPLSNPQAKVDDAETLSRQRAEVRLDVSAPSLALMIAGSLNAIGHMIAFVMCLSLPFDRQTAVIAVPGIVIGILMVIGGMNLRSLSSRAWAQVGSIAGMLPVSAGFILTAATGLWALLVTRKDNVREAFLEEERQRELRD
jgi:serine/threonine protein kinase